MSDCSTEAMRSKEPPKTCSDCSEKHWAPKCNRLGWVCFDEYDSPDADGQTFADCCLYWKAADPATLDQCFQQIDDAIEHLNELLRRNDFSCDECRSDHIQLREWLMNLKDISQRYNQLEQLAKDMWHYVVDHNTPDVPGVDMSGFEEKLESLGVCLYA